MSPIVTYRLPPPRGFDLTTQEIWALRFIANAQSPATKYRIEVGMHMPHATVAEMVARLKRRRFIRGIPQGKSRVNPDLIVEGYDLSHDGLAWALSMTKPEGMRLNWSVVAPKYERFLPLIFGKWGYFEAQGLGAVAARMLSLAAHRYVHRRDEAQIRLAFQMPGSPTERRRPLAILETYFLLYLEPYDRIIRAPEAAVIRDKDRGRLLVAIGKDLDLADYSKRAIEHLVTYHRTFPEDWSERILQKMSSPEHKRKV
jgi:hypothetical protein